MPYLDEQELAALRSEIHDANIKKDELEIELNKKIEEYDDAKHTARNRNIILGTLVGIAAALAFYFYNNQTANNIDVNSIKQAEATRVLDSISSLQDFSDENENDDENDDTNSLEEDTTVLSNSLDGETIYSVQIGVFTKNKHALLSKTIAGTVSNGELFKYSVGLFKTLREAQDFRRELVKIGFSDAFVASYINGQRQQIHKPN
ncbi:hypothetical protein C7447_102385 [Tenacibaculum adriaticum]|uniref:Sporulation related protein n=1 Tax=Tenacibaculum adriaticum TaxID=413713 RepID=A0A5S5DT65_9FLAO|nr:SPOR domain-containing protein [Tenacibaculum adriaticum]TYP99067.1 hypothetical protein C7447_102385 [Tenacibaculum adriaticum]